MPFEPFQPPSPARPGKPDLRVLSEILRTGPSHPLWPKGFVWDYGDCRVCAMGMTVELWDSSQKRPGGVPWYFKTAKHLLSLPDDVAQHIFFCLGHSWRITPERVASAIDSYLAAADAPLFESVTGA